MQSHRWYTNIPCAASWPFDGTTFHTNFLVQRKGHNISAEPSCVFKDCFGFALLVMSIVFQKKKQSGSETPMTRNMSKRKQLSSYMREDRKCHKHARRMPARESRFGVIRLHISISHTRRFYISSFVSVYKKSGLFCFFTQLALTMMMHAT